MSDAIEAIMNSLKEVFADLDADALARTQEWAKGRVAALREFKASDEYKKLSRDAWALYPRLFEIAGGKGWYQAFNGNSAEGIARHVEKHCARVVEARNASITRKLVKAGVSAVVDSTYGRTSDGFQGVFVVETNKGRKRIAIQTIVAGGYNIQCLHQRTLVNVS